MSLFVRYSKLTKCMREIMKASLKRPVLHVLCTMLVMWPLISPSESSAAESKKHIFSSDLRLCREMKPKYSERFMVQCTAFIAPYALKISRRLSP